MTIKILTFIIKSNILIENNKLVLIKNFNAKSFKPQWEDPFSVIQHDKFINYHVKENTEIKQYHRNDIKFISDERNQSETNRFNFFFLLALQNH